MVWIDVYGNVMICYGIVIGNVYKKPFNEIIGSYKHEINPIVKAISKEGPKGLLRFMEKDEIETMSGFYDECDLCYQSRKVLQKKYPEILTPLECYPGIEKK